MKKIYIAFIVASIVIGALLLAVGSDVFQENILRWLAFIPFFLFVYGVIGLIISQQVKKEETFFWWIIFPGLMGILFYILHFIHVLILEPVLCP